MSERSDRRSDGRKKAIKKNTNLSADETLNTSTINDVTKNFDCLKISIFNKASRVSDQFENYDERRVTLGPSANCTNGHNSDSINEINAKSKKALINGTQSPRSNITFSIKKILLENEVQRREKVKKVVDQKKKEMEKSQKEIQTELSELLSKMAIQREKDTAEKLALLEAEEEQIAQQLEIDRKNEFQRQRFRESEEISKKIIPFRESFLAQWKNISNVTKTCRDKHSVAKIIAPHNAKLKDLCIQMDALTEKAKNGDLAPADIKMAEILVQCNDDVYQSFKADVEKIDALYEQEIARREMEMKQAELAAQEEAFRLQQQQIQDLQSAAKEPQSLPGLNEQEVKQQLSTIPPQQITEVDSAAVVLAVAPAAPAAPVEQSIPAEQTLESTVPSETGGSTEYPDIESLKAYEESQQFLANYTASYQEFVKSDAEKNIKDFKFQCQKTLNITVNAISHVSREQLIDKYEKLRLFLSGKGTPNILLNSQAEAFSKSLLAQKIVDQGDTTISSKPELAFPFAAITVALWNDWPDFGNLLLARFHAKSPFFVPVFLLPKLGQSDDDYYKSLGCKYNEDGTPEKPEQFWKRLGGLMYLYASILVTKQRRGVNKPHPHGLGNAWRWLAATINIEPRCDIADICATLIYVLLEVTGNDLWKTYPKQFPKMLVVLNNVYYERLKRFDNVLSAPISRLGDFLINAIQTGTIPPSKGQLPPNFW